jgi:hypothetical protein
MSLFVAASICVAGDVPVLKATDLPAGTIIKTDIYSGKALFGYIDGGAELYLEYKFQGLGRQEIRYTNETVIAEIYQMSGAYEAFGIFSVQRFKCVPVDSASPHTCRSRYQLQAVVGDCYLSIVNESGSPAAQNASVEIYKAIKAKIVPQEIPLPALFRNPALSKHLSQLKVICGTLGIQNGLSEWETLFQSIPRFSLTLVPVELGSEFCRLAGFSDAKIGTIESRESAESLRAIRRLNNEETLFIEASLAFPHLKSYVDVLAN